MNIWDILILACIALAVIWALRKIHKDQKEGTCSCGCGGGKSSSCLGCGEGKKTSCSECGNDAKPCQGTQEMEPDRGTKVIESAQEARNAEKTE